MNENLEIVTHIYKDSEMSISSLKKLNVALEKKDNKIKNSIEEILQGYEEFFKKSKKILTKNKGKKEKTGIVTKVMANMGIDKEVKDDNSDSAIADLLIKGIMMGTIDLEKFATGDYVLVQQFDSEGNDRASIYEPGDRITLSYPTENSEQIMETDDRGKSQTGITPIQKRKNTR